MNVFLSNLRTNKRIQKSLYYLIVFLFGLYIFSLPSFSGRAPWNAISYVSMVLLMVMVFAYLFLYKKIRIKSRMFIPVLFLFTSILGTIIYSREYRNLITLFLLVITFFTFYFTFDAISNNRLVFYVITFAMLAFSIYFLIYYRHNISLDTTMTQSGRLGSYFDNVNQIGSYMSVGIIFSMYLGVMFNRKIELLVLLSTFVFFFIGFLTGSRTFVVSTLTGLIILLYIRFKKHKFLYLISIIILLIAFFVLINLPFMSFLKTQLSNSLYTVFGIGNATSRVDGSTVLRMMWQQYGIYLGSKNMLIGFGVAGFKIYSGIGTYTHGNFAETLCNFGIVGTFVFYLSFFIPFILMFFSKTKEKHIVLLFFVYYLINSVLSVYYYDKDLYLIFGMIYYLTNDVCKSNLNFGKKEILFELHTIRI